MLGIDSTWQIGRFYVDLVGNMGSGTTYHLGISLAWMSVIDPIKYPYWPSFGRCLSLHLIFWTLSFGYDAIEAVGGENG